MNRIGQHHPCLFLFLFCVFVSIPWHRAFTPSILTKYRSSQKHFRTFGIPLFQETVGVTNLPTRETILERIVQYGLNWKQAPLSVLESAADSTATTTTSALTTSTRVPGCTSTVHILATRVIESSHHSNSTNHNNNHVSIMGWSDAIVSRGLLAWLANHLYNKTVSDILSMDAERITDILGIRSALSRGRNDGVANMLRVIQQQLMEGQNQTTTELQPSDHFLDKTTNQQRPPTVALLLSGGVDSSVALHLLLRDGYNVTAFYLKIWLEDELSHLGECPWEEDIAICQQVCEHASTGTGSVPLKILSLQEEYHQQVMQHTLMEASLGRTPNPDILCNSRIKFGCFLDYIEKDDYDYIASGHYAQIIRSSSTSSESATTTTTATAATSQQAREANGQVKLVRAPDPIKDQSYFLCGLKQSQLARLLFPIGHLQKAQVRELANTLDLPNRHRPDSQGLCFLGKLKFHNFLQSHLGTGSGDIADALTGDVIGRHEGVWHHTVGQRKGIGRMLIPTASHRGPWYVVAKDTTKQIVYVSNAYDDDKFTQARSQCHVEQIHWIAGYPPDPLLGSEKKLSLWMKIRHGPKLLQGSLTLTQQDEEGIIKLSSKDNGLAPGQYVVFYTEEAECLGGGIISERHWGELFLLMK